MHSVFVFSAKIFSGRYITSGFLLFNFLLEAMDRQNFLMLAVKKLSLDILYKYRFFGVIYRTIYESGK